MSNRLVLAGIVAVAVAVPAGYAAAGGGSYEPSGVANPCKQRAWRNPQGAQEIAQQITSSTLDGAACTLKVSRETLARALVSTKSRDEFARERDLTNDDIAQAVRDGLVRAVDDGEKAGAIGGLRALALRAAAQNLPVTDLLKLVDNIGGLGN